MSTNSNSTTITVQPKQASFGTAGAQSIFKDQDYPETGLSTKAALRRFFTQLNPMMKQLQGFNDGNIGLANLDADYISTTVQGFTSDWNNLVNVAGGPITGIGPSAAITSFDNKAAWIAYRKDPWGRVDLALNVTVSGVGAASANLPVSYNPPTNLQFSYPQGAAASFFIVQQNFTSGPVIQFNAAGSFSTLVSYPCVTLAPAATPAIFPVYLKVKTGRTPVACFLAGAKPQTSQDLNQLTLNLGFPLACAWTFMGASTPGADGSKINQIRIDSVPGLVIQQNYVLNFLIFYGQTGSSSGA